jgi:predicted nucleotidyltransferase
MQKNESTLLDPILGEVMSRLVSAYKPNKIYLFGSRARGLAPKESDYDLLLVVSDHTERELKMAGRAYEVLWGIKVPIDVLVWTDTEFNKRLHPKNSLPAVVIREGKLLHVA